LPKVPPQPGKADAPSNSGHCGCIARIVCPGRRPRSGSAHPGQSIRCRVIRRRVIRRLGSSSVWATIGRRDDLRSVRTVPHGKFRQASEKFTQTKRAVKAKFVIWSQKPRPGVDRPAKPRALPFFHRKRHIFPAAPTASTAGQPRRRHHRRHPPPGEIAADRCLFPRISDQIDIPPGGLVRAKWSWTRNSLSSMLDTSENDGSFLPRVVSPGG